MSTTKKTEGSVDSRRSWTWLMPAVSVVFAALFFTPFLVILAVFFFPRTSLIVGLLYAPFYFDNVQSDPKKSRRTLFLLNSPLWFCIRDWFRMTLRRASPNGAPFDPKRRRIWGLHPHGIDTFQLAAFISELCDFRGVFGSSVEYPRLVAASAVLRIPLIRDIFLSYGTVEASKGTLQKTLRGGVDVALVTGGSQEVILMSPGDDVVFLRKRKGFIRLALEEGVDLVPTWTFGACDAFSQIVNPSFQRAMSWIITKFKFVIPIYWGIGFSPVPYRVTQTIVVGDPICVDRVENPTKAQVDSLHSKYIAALEKIHGDHKQELGFGDRTLRVV